MLKKFIIILCFVSVLHACGHQKKREVSLSHDRFDDYHGIWRSSGYGYLLNIDDKGLRLYDESKGHCFEKDLDGDELSMLFTEFRAIDENTIRMGMSEQSTLYTFKRSPQKLALVCSQRGTVTAETVVDYFAEVMNTHYAFFDLYNVNWQQRVKKAQADVSSSSSDEMLYQVLVNMMKGLKDGHLFLQAEINGSGVSHTNGSSRYLRPALDEAFARQAQIKEGGEFRRSWYKKDLTNIMKNVLNEAYLAANDRIVWGKIDNVGYVNLLGMQGLTKGGVLSQEIAVAKKAMDHIITDLQDTTALIIDVTTNSGGNDELGVLYAGYFADKKTLAYRKSAKGAEHLSQSFYIEPHANIRYLKPVYLLTSDHTVSAAETFTIAMRALPQVVHVGDTTRGALSDILDKSLPNGWQLGLSNETYLDSNDQLWESHGLPPQHYIAVFSQGDILNGHEHAINQVLTLIDQL